MSLVFLPPFSRRNRIAGAMIVHRGAFFCDSRFLTFGRYSPTGATMLNAYLALRLFANLRRRRPAHRLQILGGLLQFHRASVAAEVVILERGRLLRRQPAHDVRLGELFRVSRAPIGIWHHDQMVGGSAAGGNGAKYRGHTAGRCGPVRNVDTIQGMTKRTAAKIQAFRVKEPQPIVHARAQVYKVSTTIPAKELVEWLGTDGDVLMVRVTWKREAYLIWKDDWESAADA